MIKDILRHKTLCRSIFMMAGLFVFLSGVNFVNAALSMTGNWDPNDANVMEGPRATAISGDYAYVVGNSDNLVVVDISDPVNPSTVGVWDPNDLNVMENASSIAISGFYAYITGGGSDNLIIIDISNPTSPTLVGNWDPNNENVMNYPYTVAASGSHVYVSGYATDNLAIIDVSNPANPTLVGNWIPSNANVMDGAISVAVSGDFAYVTGAISDNLAIVDISNPTSPTTVGNWDPNDVNIMDYARSVAVSGSYAYVAGYVSSNLAVIDISTPTNPTLISNWDPNDANLIYYPKWVSVSGSYAFLSCHESDNLAIVDISNPTTPVTVDNWDPNDVSIMDRASFVAISDSYAYVTSYGSDSLAIIDISDYVSSSEPVSDDCGDSVIHEGQSYDTVQIGDQCWFQENLNVGTMLANPATLPSNSSEIEKWCYDNNSANCDTDGGLYAWAETNGLDPSCNTSSCFVQDENQGICPSGWHIPTDQEFMILEEHLGVCTGVGAGCTEATSWRGTDQGSQIALNGSNTSGFSGLTSGTADNGGNTFWYRGLAGYLQTASEHSATTTWYRSFNITNGIFRSLYGKVHGLSVRCIKNTDSVSSDVTIQDPNTTKIQNAIDNNHISLDNGTIDNTDQTTTQANLTFASTNASALFPINTIITEQSNGNYNFQNFTIQDKSIQNTAAAIDLGIPGTDLSFSQDITLTLNVGDTYNDQTLNVYSQSTGQTDWTLHTTCTVSEGDCTFTTNHATIYTAGGIPGAIPIDINVEVQDTLTLDCHDTQGTTGDYTVTLGTTTDQGKVTSGSPAVGQSTCTVTTNDDQGYYLTLVDDNAAASAVLTHDDPNTSTTYEIQDLTQFPATTTWNAPTTKGLGFSVITFPDTQTDNNTVDDNWTNTSQCPEGTNPDTNDYAGIPDTPQTISAVTQYEANHTTTNICYKVDVPASQASGQYTGSVTYTATSDASSYLN